MISSLQNKKILVAAAHPDDEVIGIGGTVHRLVSEMNCEAHCLILGEGLTARGSTRDEKDWSKELEHHRNNMKKASELIGYKSSTALNFPDNRFDSVALLDIVKEVEKKCNEVKPDLIFTHHEQDLNVDHRMTFEAVLTANRPQPGHPDRTILTFETLSSTEWQSPSQEKAFLPNFFFKLSQESIEAKVKALEAYDTEIKEYPHPRSSKGLIIAAQRWGLNIGCEHAEAFQLIRGII